MHKELYVFFCPFFETPCHFVFKKKKKNRPPTKCLCHISVLIILILKKSWHIYQLWMNPDGRCKDLGKKKFVYQENVFWTRFWIEVNHRGFLKVFLIKCSCLHFSFFWLIYILSCSWHWNILVLLFWDNRFKRMLLVRFL